MRLPRDRDVLRLHEFHHAFMSPLPADADCFMPPKGAAGSDTSSSISG